MDVTRRTVLKSGGSAVALGAVGTVLPDDVSLAAGEGSSGSAEELCFLSARELGELIRSRKVSAREVMAAHLKQIERVNRRLNAIVARLDDDQCLALAAAADELQASGAPLGPLHGLPIAIKDTEPAVGFPFTYGSPIYRHLMPGEDSEVVARLRRAGVLIIGKTNVPEFGMGSHTYNNVYGTTFNPYDPTRCAGGSSGGAAVALATGMLPIANGSDLGGSLRNPGNFNNIVGFRPTIGLVPASPVAMPFGNLGVKGPLARSVADVSYLTTVMAGPDAFDPQSYPSDPAIFARPLERSMKGVRVAWCPDLGVLPMDAQVRQVIEPQRAVFERLGCIVEEACPDLSGVDEAFVVLRQWRSWVNLGPLLGQHRAQMKPEAIQEIEAGAALTTSDITKAITTQAQVMARMTQFQQEHEFLLCTVNQVPPFDASLDWPKEIAGTKMESYIAWMKSAYWISSTGHPAISVPAGFTSGGLPVGIQMVGRYRADFELLQFAHAFEQATQVGKRRPAIAVSAG